jgi:tRNA (adenine37-N6)-methyltransferase
LNDATPAGLTLEPIGVLRCAQQTKVEAPRQPAAAAGLAGVIELYPRHNYEHALEDLAGWTRIWVIFWFHLNRGWRPKVLPPRSEAGRKGVFSTRSPHRPNPLGLSVLRLERVDGLRVHVRDVDLVDGTPVLDIKPYVPYSDAFPDSPGGWLTADPVQAHTVRFSPRAEAQLAWIAGRGQLALRERVQSTLQLGPQPHPYRRIKRLPDGGLRLAVRDWRIDFTADALQVEVHGVRSGYQAAQLALDAPDPAGTLALHRAFRMAWQDEAMTP